MERFPVGGTWDEPTALEAAAREARRAILVAAAAAVAVFLLLGPAPRLAYGPVSTTNPVEVDATVSAWFAQAEAKAREKKPPPQAGTSAPRLVPRRTPAPPQVDARIDLNAVTAVEIDRMVPGFGRILSERLVAARPAGGWNGWAEIRAVEGIGPKRLEDLKDRARL